MPLLLGGKDLIFDDLKSAFSKGGAHIILVKGNLRPGMDVRINYINGFLLFSVHLVSDLNRLRREMLLTQAY